MSLIVPCTECGKKYKVGDDKAAKHPYLVCESSLLILNGIDLSPYVPFDLAGFRDDVQRLKPGARLLKLSAKTGEGLEQWIGWLIHHVQQKMALAHA